jgi:hypothetical protein
MFFPSFQNATSLTFRLQVTSTYLCLSRRISSNYNDNLTPGLLHLDLLLLTYLPSIFHAHVYIFHLMSIFFLHTYRTIRVFPMLIIFTTRQISKFRAKTTSILPHASHQLDAFSKTRYLITSDKRHTAFELQGQPAYMFESMRCKLGINIDTVNGKANPRT